jgi:hypothetical protein
MALCVGLALPGGAGAATAIGLGTADSYAVLGGSGVTNTGPTVLGGDLGSWPTPSITGFGGAPDGTVNGATHAADAAAAQAQSDLTVAYDSAAGQGPPNTLATELGGATLTPGVYTSQSGTFGITGALTLDAQGNPSSVFIFQTATTLISETASQVNLINGAQPCNVFWKVGSSATLGTSSAFAGNVLALQSISVNNGVAINGRLLARNGAVTLINDTVTRATCAPTTGGGAGEGGGGSGAGGGTGGGKGGSGGKGAGKGGGGGKGGAGNKGAGPTIRAVGIPTGGGGGGEGPTCVDRAFTTTFTINDPVGLRRVEVFLDGKLIRRTTAKHFSVRVGVAGLRTGSNTIRVVAVDKNGLRDVLTRTFRHCAAEATNQPEFTG